MTEEQLLGPRAHGEPCGKAVLKAVAEDFQVDEVLDLELSGAGEHLWLWVEKRNLNTEEAARRIAKAAGVSMRMVSYAGLKDRQALTRQWFSIHLPGKTDPDLSKAEDETLSIVKTTRHSRKLQRGAHAANGFILRLTQLEADKAALELRLNTLKTQGVPNYFGLQRFGFAGGNVFDAKRFAENNHLPTSRNVRSRMLSAARSYLFNQMLALRVADKTWNQAQLGDLLAFTESRSFFPATQKDLNDPRLGILDLHPTGALWGIGDSPAGDKVFELEQGVAAQEAQLCAWLASADLKQERRILRLPIRDLAWHYPTDDTLQLQFVLPSGCFATSVVRELVDLASHTDSTCIF